MGKMVFMTFEYDRKKQKKVKVISVSEEPTKEKVKPPKGTWLKSKKSMHYNFLDYALCMKNI